MAFMRQTQLRHFVEQSGEIQLDTVFQHVRTSFLFEGTSVSETCATQNAKLVEDKRKKAGTAQKAGAFYIIL